MTEVSDCGIFIENKYAIYCITEKRKNMNAKEIVASIDERYALFGLFFAFHNRLQAVGDTFYEEITCKQFFLFACMNLYTEEAPTANELAETMGCSRQNVKQILNSLGKKGWVQLRVDENDKRKQRIYLTEKTALVAGKYKDKETSFMKQLFDGVSSEEAKRTYMTISKMEDNLIKIKGEK